MSAVSAVNHDELLGYAAPKSREETQIIVPNSFKAERQQEGDVSVTDQSAAQQAIAIVKGRALALREQTTTLVKHPKFQTIALGGGSGLVVMGSTCCFIGGGVGFAVGTAVGFVPALFTFGLSIPVGAVIGAAVGTGVGLTAGGGGGLIVGGAAGHLGHAYRAEIKNGFLHIKTKTGERTVDLQALIMKVVEVTKAKALELTDLTLARATSVHALTKGQAIKLSKQARDVAVHPKFHATAASAAGGAVVVGAGGGAAGLVSGGMIGAAVGLVPALFTFGLSIPIGAAIGGGTGLCVGTAAGSTAGAVGGGATGYHAHTYRKEIRSGASGIWTKASTYAGKAKSKITGSVAGTTL